MTEQAIRGEGVVIDRGAVRFERLLPGPVDLVWSYLTESPKRATWLASGPMDLQSGGQVDLTFDNESLSVDDDPTPERFASPDDSCGNKMLGKVTACDPPRLLSFTWGENGITDSEVTFELAPQGEDVLLTLTHRRLPNRGQMVNVSGGWHTHLDILVARLQDRDAGRFWPAYLDHEAHYQTKLTDADALH